MNGERYALLIANAKYDNKQLSQLAAPAEDAKAFEEILTNKEIGGFDKVSLLINQSLSIVRQTIESFFAKKKPDDLLLLYFSGHGVLDTRGRLYFTTKDTRPEALASTGLEADWIRDRMDDSRSKRQIIILDSCYSGSFVKGSRSVIGAKVGIDRTFEGNGYGRVVLTSTNETELAWEGSAITGEIEKSLFTHYLIEGIKNGEASHDNQWITVDDIYEFAYKNVISHQNPQKWAFKSEGNLFLAKVPKTRCTGIIKSWRDSYGFIQQSDGADVFFHISAIQDVKLLPITVGSKVLGFKW